MLCFTLEKTSHDKAELQIVGISADHDLALFVQGIQYSLQFLRATAWQALALKIIA